MESCFLSLWDIQVGVPFYISRMCVVRLKTLIEWVLAKLRSDWVVSF